MKKSKYTKEEIIVSIIASSLIVLYGAYTFYLENKRANKVLDYLEKTYPYIKLEDSVNNKIIFVYVPKNIKNVAHIQHVVLDNGKKYTLDVPVSSLIKLRDVAIEGSIIVKPRYSNVLTIEKNNKTYKFIINNPDN